jgi:hypothetical protein
MFILNALRAAQIISYSAQCAFKIWREQLYLDHEGRLCCSRRLYDKIEQLPPYLECALSNFRDSLNAHSATLGASMISLEQEKNAQNWVTANKIRLSLY